MGAGNNQRLYHVLANPLTLDGVLPYPELQVYMANVTTAFLEKQGSWERLN
jgi:hypothetical protein